eukprot:2830-Pyramimonas_sp.AAC.1
MAKGLRPAIINTFFADATSQMWWRLVSEGRCGVIVMHSGATCQSSPKCAAQTDVFTHCKANVGHHIRQPVEVAGPPQRYRVYMSNCCSMCPNVVCMSDKLDANNTNGLCNT